MKTVNIQVKWAAAHPGQDRRLPGVVTHSRLWRATSVRSRVVIVFKKKTAPGSLSTGSPAGRTPPHGDGSMCSQANARTGKVLRPPIRALPSVIVDTEKVLREADGSVELVLGKTARGWKGVRTVVRLECRSGEPVRSPKIRSVSSCRCSTTSHGDLQTI